MDESSEDRPAVVQGMEWAARVITISLEMVLPGLLGFWIDRKLGTVMVFLVLGAALGMTVGMIHLVRLANPPKEPTKPPASDRDGSGGGR